MPALTDYIPPVLAFDSSVPVIAFNQKSKMNQKTQLGGDIPMPEEKLDEKEAAEAEDLTYYPYLKQMLNLHIVHD